MEVGLVLLGRTDAAFDARCAPYGPTREEKEPERLRFETPRALSVITVQF